MRFMTQPELRAELKAAADELIAKHGMGRFKPNHKKDKRGGSRGATAPAFRAEAPARQQSVYVVGSGGHPVKIGIATTVGDRVKTLQVGYPHELRAYYHAEVPDGRAREVERLCHQRLAEYRTRGEWFDVDPYVAVDVVKATIAAL